jgi:hypothetical protein
MRFTRKRIKGQKAKTKKTRLDESGDYRITWTNTMCGVKVDTPYFHACVRACRPDGSEYWGFAGRRGPYKTLKAAQKACETNQKLWNQFCRIKGRTKVTQVRRLRANNFIGTGKAAVPIMSDMPAWVFEQADQRLIDIWYPKGKLKEDDECDCESPSDPTETSKSSDSPDLPEDTNSSETAGPVSPVEVLESAGTPPPTARQPNSKTPAKRAAGRGKAPAKRSSKRTVKKSRGGKSKSK